MELKKLNPTNLFISTNLLDTELYDILGTYKDYELDFDVKPFIMPSINKEVKNIFSGKTSLCDHFYDYTKNEYNFMLNDAHSLQSLIETNIGIFDDELEYYFYKLKNE